MIAGVLTCRNEEDIVAETISHLLKEGVDLILVADGRSTDGTRDILQDLKEETKQVEWYDDGGEWRQQTWVDRLAGWAHERGAEWIVPFDADEFWFDSEGETLEKLFAAMAGVDIVQATLYHHTSRDLKVVPAEGLPKAAYRWAPGRWIGPGNHTVSGEGITQAGRLEIRHFQFRSYEHFCRKVAERIQTLPPDIRARGDGSHMMRLDGASEDQMRAAWAELEARETILDPIPVW